MKFSEFLDVRDGTHDSPKRVNIGKKLITTKNLEDNRIDFTNAKNISLNDFKRINERSKVDQFDNLLSMIGTVGNVYQERSAFPDYAIKNLALLKFHGDELLSNWMNYYLQSKKGQSKIHQRLSGSTQQYISLTDLRNIEITLPNRDQMELCIKPLRYLDDLILKNNQINDNLVKLVDSYFINFLNNVTTVEKTIEDIGTVVGGGTPSKKIADYWNGDIAWVTPKDLSQHPLIFTSSGENYITGLGLAKGSAKLLPTNTILFSSRAPIGYISIAKNNLATNQGFKSVIPNKEYSFQFIYELLKHETAAIKNEANGSTFKEISGKKLKQHIINIPNSEDTSKFNEITKPIFKQLRKLEEENEELLAIKKGLLEKYF